MAYIIDTPVRIREYVRRLVREKILFLENPTRSLVKTLEVYLRPLRRDGYLLFARDSARRMTILLLNGNFRAEIRRFQVRLVPLLQTSLVGKMADAGS